MALSLSDSFCVERHKESFAEFVENDVDIIVADEDEVYMLRGVDRIEAAIDSVRGTETLWAITRSEKGSVIVQGDEVVTQEATPVGASHRHDRRG